MSTCGLTIMYYIARQGCYVVGTVSNSSILKSLALVAGVDGEVIVDYRIATAVINKVVIGGVDCMLLLLLLS